MTAPLAVQVRYFAAAREAAGLAHETIELETGATGADLVARARAQHGPGLGRVLEVSSLLVEGVVTEDLTLPLGAPGQDHVRVDVLPPFAGG